MNESLIKKSIYGSMDTNCLGLIIYYSGLNYILLEYKEILDINDIFYKFISIKFTERIHIIVSSSCYVDSFIIFC